METATLLESYGRLNRLIGDLRTECVHYELRSHAYNDSRESLKKATSRLAEVEQALVDMGLMGREGRYTDLELNKGAQS